MSAFFSNITNILKIVNPIMTFLVLISVFSFLGFLKFNLEKYFKNINHISDDLNRIANENERKNTDLFR